LIKVDGIAVAGGNYDKSSIPLTSGAVSYTVICLPMSLDGTGLTLSRPVCTQVEHVTRTSKLLMTRCSNDQDVNG
jgi:hypothetical protein